ncbi:protein TEX261-like [Pomacea canaliculata]|uniref:protein TEX261-like n=1 Tax=Pomacea canaliculata TaxID=400727 RepID=UPI000D72F57F|nr:protein TEX261-like [Pomacea canaliculata]
MWFMYALSWIALAIQISVATLSIAAGLYYLAELVEEYTVMTAKIIRFLIGLTTVVYILIFLFENFPLLNIAVGLLTNIAYSCVLQNFPFFDITSPAFIASLVLLFFDHYLAFSYFSDVWYPFAEVLAFFTICLWLVPFAFFVSLSANENTLPMTADVPRSTDDSDIVSNYFSHRRKKYGLLSLFKNVQDSVLPQRMKKSY